MTFIQRLRSEELSENYKEWIMLNSVGTFKVSQLIPIFHIHSYHSFVKVMINYLFLIRLFTKDKEIRMKQYSIFTIWI